MWDAPASVCPAAAHWQGGNIRFGKPRRQTGITVNRHSMPEGPPGGVDMHTGLSTRWGGYAWASSGRGVGGGLLGNPGWNKTLLAAEGKGVCLPGVHGFGSTDLSPSPQRQALREWSRRPARPWKRPKLPPGTAIPWPYPQWPVRVSGCGGGPRGCLACIGTRCSTESRINTLGTGGIPTHPPSLPRWSGVHTEWEGRKTPKDALHGPRVLTPPSEDPNADGTMRVTV